MKKFFLFAFIFTAFSLNSYAIEEINLDLSDEKPQNTFNYLSDVYYGKVEDASPVLKVISKEGISFDNSFVDSVKLGLVFAGDLVYFINTNKKTCEYDFTAIEPSIKVKFNDNKDEFVFSYNITRFIDGYEHDFWEKMSLLYVAHNINENQKILLGQGARLPVSYDGAVGLYDTETVHRSQLGRNLGNIRSVGIRNIAKYKYLDYDIGLYDSTRYMQSFGKGADFTGYVMLKPLGDNPEGNHNVKAGMGYNVGKYRNSYSMYSFLVSYDYKKFHIHAEYANANGFNGIQSTQSNAYGFYTLASYKITPKLELLARYDTYTPDKSAARVNSQEYTAGITYNLFKNLKLMLNYTKRINSQLPNADVILFATRFII